MLIGIQVVEQVDAPFLYARLILIRCIEPYLHQQTFFLSLELHPQQENASYSNGTINLCFNVTLYGPNNITKGLVRALYQGDWMERVEGCPYPNTADYFQNFLQFSVNVTDIPFGEHSLNITALAYCEFEDNSHFKYFFSLNKTSSINFSVRTNPIITFPSFQNVYLHRFILTLELHS